MTAIVTNGQWIKQTVNTSASFRGLSVVNEKVIWASGTGGTVIKTTDGGKNWSVIQVADAVKLDFRDIEAFDAKTSYILSIGNGESSRIYKTTDGGKTWNLQFKNTNEKAFFDAMACWDKSNYYVGQRIDESRAVLDQSSQAILEKANLDTLPGITTAFLTALAADRTEWKACTASQSTEISRAKTERAQRNAMVDSIRERRTKLQFAADASWPWSNPENAGVRGEFKLPQDRPLTF